MFGYLLPAFGLTGYLIAIPFIASAIACRRATLYARYPSRLTKRR